MIHGTFLHNSPKVQNYTHFSCKVVEIDGTFFINNLHNQFLMPKDIQELNRTRPVQTIDFIFNDLKVVVTQEILNKEECFTLYFLDDLTFFENHTVVSCGKGETRFYCGDFRLIFYKGVVSHLRLRSHFAKLDWTGSIMEPLEENISKGVIEPVFPLEQEDNEQLELDTENAGEWLIREDILQTVGLAVGFCVSCWCWLEFFT